MGIYTNYPDSIYNDGAGGGGGNMAIIGGHAYQTVIIGSQEWLAENFDFKFSGLVIGGSNTSTSEPRGNYYNNDEITYGATGYKYGILYNWFAVNYLENNKESLIPGWHVPTPNEWDSLVIAVGGASGAGTKLKSSNGWSSGAGTNDYGFSALPSGYYYGRFGGLGTNANFWTATQYDSSNAIFRGFNTGANIVYATPSKADQYSVRLVKDSA